MSQFILRKNLKNTPSNRDKNPPANMPQPVRPVEIESVVVAGTLLTLTFSGTVTLEGTPKLTTDIAGAAPVSAVQTAPNVVEITFDNDIAAATRINIPFRDQAIRNSSGGFVVSNTFPV